MRTLIAVGLIALYACGPSKGRGDDDDGDGGNTAPDACVGLECQVVNCEAMGMPATTITGTVFAPNGTLPLNGVNVYVPRDPLPLPAFVEGATCDRCSSSLPGGAVAQAVSAENGSFTLTNVPSGSNVPVVITTGKWRRVVTLPSVNQCAQNTLGTEESRLPRNKAEGDIPRIALTTGGADSLECLVKKLGVDDAEVGTSGSAGRVHFYEGQPAAAAPRDPVSKFKAGHPGGTGEFADAVPFWSSVNNLKAYDIVFLSCEGAQNPGDKNQDTLNAMKAYADLGGRVFASHWHNIWIGGNFSGSQAPPVWKDIATWDGANNSGSTIFIDEATNPKGTAFANWMVNVGGSTTRGEIELVSGTGRLTAGSVDPAKGERWVRTTSDNPQMFQFTTPNEAEPDDRCGKVVFTDMHVSGDPAASGEFPDCGSNTLTPQEKALAFMFFDIASCVGVVE